jgi:hypothetical protein
MDFGKGCCGFRRNTWIKLLAKALLGPFGQNKFLEGRYSLEIRESCSARLAAQMYKIELGITLIM